MSGVHRFLSRREKKPSKTRHSQETPRSPETESQLRRSKRDDFGNIFTIKDDPSVAPDKEEERKIQDILERLHQYGVNDMTTANVRYALRLTYSQREGEAAFRLLMLLQETYDGLLQPYNPNNNMLGAVNRDGVTCYLDALLFAMFARLDSFEAMLYDNFEDPRRRRLAGLLRLWVNLLRTGHLITTDVTRHIQEALVNCGWRDAALTKQQDPSEAFAFITGQLKLPLLTLKMDLYHTGKEDPQDDHKFINERLLEVAILDQPPDGHSVLTLEDCLENYFNNRVEVKRHLENQRRNTLKTGNVSMSVSTKQDAESAIHIETIEVPESPGMQTPTTDSPAPIRHPLDKIRPVHRRKRQDSIFSQRKVEVIGIDPAETGGDQAPENTNEAPERKTNTINEVLMPAWQFFKLLPWYTDHMPTTDAQVAAHFSKKRPVLGICLKRYAYTDTGQATRKGTYIDIPLEIAVPDFVSDEHMHEDGPLAGNFRLLLQSVLCHRGVSVHSGHYVCLSRAQAARPSSRATGSDLAGDSADDNEVEAPWMRFDDLARERIAHVDIREALKEETPYLLFYQVQPIDDDGRSIPDLPSYAEATSQAPSDVYPFEKPYMHIPAGSDTRFEETQTQEIPSNQHRGSDGTDFALSSQRTSLDSGGLLNYPRSHISVPIDSKRHSVGTDDLNLGNSNSSSTTRTDAGVSIPTSPVEERNSSGFLGIPHRIGSRRGSRPSKSRTNSTSRPDGTGSDAGGGRFSLSMSRLTQRMSRNDGHPAGESSTGLSRTPTLDDPNVPTNPDPAAGVTSEQPPAHDVPTAPPVAAATEGSDTTDRSETLPSKPLSKKDKAASRHDRRSKSTRGNEERDCTVM